MACAICKTRREKRHCPGVQGEICAICCGEEREETVDCPLDCEYLRIAHEHESRVRKDPAGMPNATVRISQDQLRKNTELLLELQIAMLVAAMERNAIDQDVREALDGLVRTYQTLGSGLYYESRPSNPIAAGIFDQAQQRVGAIRSAENERGVHKLRDADILSLLIFLQQMEYSLSNGRKRGRCYLDSLRSVMAEALDGPRPDPAPLIVS